MGKVDNVRILRTAVGNVNAVKFMGSIARGRQDELRDVEIRELKHPIRITATLSDIEMLAEARVSPIYQRLPELLGDQTELPVVDVGANIGTTATLFASLFPNAPVTAIEPFERNREVLRHNVAPYGTRVEVLPHAVTATGGVAVLVNPDAATNDEFCGLRFDGSPNEDGEQVADGTEVSAITLIELLDHLGNPDEIGVFKLDVEGGERELATAGLVDVLSRTHCFVVETHDRFRPGATAAVGEAAAAAGLTFELRHENDYFFVR